MDRTLLWILPVAQCAITSVACSNNDSSVDDIAHTGAPSADASIRSGDAQHDADVGAPSSDGQTKPVTDNLADACQELLPEPQPIIVYSDAAATGVDRDAMTDAAPSSLDCQWKIPDPPDGVVYDWERINVMIRIQDGTFQVVGRVPSAVDCAQRQEGGWYYDNPTNPIRVVLCPMTCDVFRALVSARIELEMGCPEFTYQNFN